MKLFGLEIRRAREPRYFRQTFRVSSCVDACSSTGLERELQYQRTYAYVRLGRDLEKAGVIKRHNASTGDETHEVISLRID